MPTVQQILKDSGFTDDQIASLDAKAVGAFTNVLSSAEQAREAAEVAQRANAQFYDEQIAPALNNWGSEKAEMEARNAYYRSQLESARSSGFVPSDLPGQPRDAGGRYASGASGSTPGSPTYLTQEDIDRRLGQGMSNVTWMIQEYARAYNGAMIPDSIDKIALEASNQRLPVRDYFARKYDLAGKQAEQQKKQQEEHDLRIVRDTEAKLNREWAEKTGSNPDIRRGEPSRFSEVARAVKSGTRPDPLTMNDAQRRQATTIAIRREINDRDEVA